MVPDASHPGAVAVDRDVGELVWRLALQEEQLLVFTKVTLVEHPERPEVDLPPEGAALLVPVTHGARGGTG